ncbi:exodeoxyribonuclease I [Marinospirillum alkaliphilum]|uniref:Exodeoxyribonuclease I n=1 Tax=Marinospirillum alkaliphilum DSM 21637 TaxID=1122209 RepID=A0A1K1ZVD9_9GAMM|nr:exodeoxyribonuclease I [Marinospirillum alkaliphilum]SFX77715.1 Exodeoxyribonuclease I subunit C [Marinospirillum alkaliphilum DSM 21637]
MNRKTDELTFLWHDYETFGADTRRDRPCQFAAIRTDADFNEIGEPQMFYCQPADDYLPHPMALLITGITPQHARREGMPEAEFAGEIHALMSQPRTCVVGYNSIRFDDEVTRQMFYRNFIDPYGREWQNGNSRWDLIDLVRATYALRPEGIQWPRKEDGSPSFRLEDLTAANGISHGDAAHDALADVRATIALARLLRQAQPRLFDHLFSQRGKHQAAALLDLNNPRPLLHVSSRFPASRGCCGIVLPLAAHPTNPNGVIVYDLSEHPQELLSLSAEALHERVFTTQAELEAKGQKRVPLKLVHLNRCPVLLPVKAMEPANAARLGLDLTTNEQHWQVLQQADAGVADKVRQVFAAESGFTDAGDPDLMLYSGAFFSNADRQRFDELRRLPPETLGETPLVFDDPRAEEMLFRYRARNWPEYLTSAERERWDEFRWQKINSPQLSSLTLRGLEQELLRLSQQPLDEEQRFLLQELQFWVESLLPLQFME